MTDPQAVETTAKQNRTLLVVLPFTFLIGLGLAVWAVFLAQFHLELLLRGEAAMGIVVALEPGTSSSASGRSALFPIVSFESSAGQTITFRHRTGSNPSAFSKGDHVPVTYLANSPEKALIAEGFRNWLLPILLLIVGPGVMIVSLWGIIKTWQHLRR